jgi:hypothetical protein
MHSQQAILPMMATDTPVVFLLDDEFVTTEVAPMATPRACEPGPGSLVISDPANKIHISADDLIFDAGNNSVNTNVTSAAIAHSPGFALIFRGRVVTGQFDFGFGTAAYTRRDSFEIAQPTGAIYTGGGISVTALIPIVNNTVYNFTIIRAQSGGAYFVANDVLYWYDNTVNVAALLAWAAVYAPTSSGRLAYWRHAQLPAPWTTDYGIATARVALPAVNETITAEANANIEQTWQAVTGETWELSVRRTDADNRWIIRCDQAGSTIKLIKREAGAESELDSKAQTWTNGTSYRVWVTLDGNRITTYVANAIKNNYASAAFNNAATGVHTNKAGANLIAWPRVLSGGAKTTLARFLA